MEQATPIVTIAIPLFRSKRFLPIIRQNLLRIDWPTAEILISDRHGDDDTLSLLRQEFDSDSRIRFLENRDRIGWVDHYNALLTEARGTYFAWFPHDDTFPEGYVSDLVNDLERHPEAWLSFGRLYAVEEDTDEQQMMYLPDRLRRNTESWQPDYALKLLGLFNLGIPFRGVFRRERVLEKGLLIRHTQPNDQFADIYWVFAVALQGKLFYNDHQSCLKRYYAGSTHHAWSEANYFVTSAAGRRAIEQYIKTAGLPWSKEMHLLMNFRLLCGLRWGFGLLSARVKKRLKRWFGVVSYQKVSPRVEANPFG